MKTKIDREKWVKKMTDNITVVENMRNYDNDPTIIKRAEEAIEFLKKYGLPESYKKRNINLDGNADECL